MKLVNSIKFERKTRTPDHSNNNHNSKNQEKLKKNLDIYEEESYGSLVKTDKDQLFLQMQHYLTKKKAKLRKMQIFSLKEQMKKMENIKKDEKHGFLQNFLDLQKNTEKPKEFRQVEKNQEKKQIFKKLIETDNHLLENEKIDEKLDEIQLLQEKLLEFKLKYCEKTQENRILKEKLIKTNHLIINNSRLFDKSLSIEQNLASINLLNENISKIPAFDAYFQSSSSQINSKEVKSKAFKEKSTNYMKNDLNTVYLQLSMKLTEVKKSYKELTESYVHMKGFFDVNSSDFKKAIFLFLKGKLNDFSEKIEYEKREYMNKLEEESLSKLQTVIDKYERTEKDLKTKHEAEIAKKEQIINLFQTLLNDKSNELKEKNTEIEVLRSQIEKNTMFPLNLERKTLPNKKIKELEQSNLVLNELLRTTNEKLEIIKSFYENKFSEYEKKLGNMIKLQEETRESLEPSPSLSISKIERKNIDLTNIQEKQENCENIVKNEDKQERIEIITKNEENENFDKKQGKNEKSQKNNFLKFEEAQSKFQQKDFDKKIIALKAKYHEIIKKLNEEIFILKQDKEKTVFELDLKEKQFSEVFNENLCLKVEKLNLDEKLKKSQEYLKEKEYQLLVKTSIAASGCEGNSALMRDFKKGLNPLIITPTLYKTKDIEIIENSGEK